LECANNQLSDLSGIVNCNELFYLDCSNNQLTDLSPLYELSRLRELNIANNPNLTEAEIERFRQHKPNCEIIC